MWGKSDEERLKQIGLTKEQIDKISDKTNIGVGLITEILLETKKMDLLKL